MIIDGQDVGSYMEYKHQFSGMIHEGGMLSVAKMELEFQFVATLDDPVGARDAFSKIKYFLDTALSHCIFIDINSPEMPMLINSANNNFVMLPGIPSEDLIVHTIQRKLTKIAGDVLYVGLAKFTSDISQAVYAIKPNQSEYTLPATTKECTEEFECFHEFPWWDREDGITIELIKTPGDERPINELYSDFVDPFDDFADAMEFYNASMSEESATSKTKEPKEAELVNIKWKPQVV